MKLKYLLLLFLSGLCFKDAVSQNLMNPVSAEAWGVGGASATSQNVFAVFNNPSAYSDMHQLQCGIYSEQRLSQTRLSSAAFSLVAPSGLMNFGFAVSHLADTFYNQEKISASLSKRLSKHFSVGATFSFLAIYTKDLPFRGNFFGELGAFYDATSKLRFGLFIFNPTQSNYSSFSSDKIPTYGRIGVEYDISDRLKILFEAQQQLHEQILFRGGIRFDMNGLLSLSAGASDNPVYITMGIGLRLNKFKLDYAASFHEILGYAPHLGISFPDVK